MQDLVMGRPTGAPKRKKTVVSEETTATYLSVDAEIDALLARAEILIAKKLTRAKLESPSEARKLLIARLANRANEEMHVIFLDNRNRIIAINAMFQGTIDSATIHPRVIVQEALRLGAASCVLAHCHPSGNPEPSSADRALTSHIKQALALVDVRLLDHIVVGGTDAVSLAERGWV